MADLDLVKPNLWADLSTENVKLDENVIAGEVASESIFHLSRSVKIC